jgi:hypothetical protein
VTAADPATPEPGFHRLLWWALGIGAALSIAVCWGVARQTLVVGSADGGWHYPYGPPASAALVSAWVLWSAAAAGLVVASWRLAAARPWWILLMWILAATGLQWTLRSMEPYPLEAQFVSDNSNSFYSVARQHDAADILRSFDRVRRDAPVHVQSNMPGKLLLTHALQLVSSRTDVLPWLLIGLSNLGAILMYGFVRDLFDSPKVALSAAALYLFVPGRIFFFPLMNTITPLLVLACAWLLVKWIRTGRTMFAVMMGVALYGLVLFEPLPLVIGLLFLALVFWAIARGEIAPGRFVLQSALAICAFIVAAETVLVMAGFDVLRAFDTIRAHALEFNETASRPYRLWLAANLWEFAFATGWCAIVTGPGALVYACRSAGSWRERMARPIVPVCIGSLAVLAAVDVIGINRGEVTRLWIFLACFFQIPAAYVCATLNTPWALALVLFMSALQAAAGFTLIRFVVP